MGLLKPAWLSENWDKVQKAIEKESNQNSLAKIAKVAPLGGARIAALKKLNDQSLLADIAVNDRDWEVRKTAVEKLENKNVLANIAKRDEMSLVGEAAAKSIIDQNILFEIVHDTIHISVRKIAVDMITDQQLLNELALSKNVDWDAKLTAADKLADRAFAIKIYSEIANSQYREAREAADERLERANDIYNNDRLCSVCHRNDMKISYEEDPSYELRALCCVRCGTKICRECKGKLEKHSFPSRDGQLCPGCGKSTIFEFTGKDDYRDLLNQAEMRYGK